MEHISIITDLATVSVLAGIAAIVFHMLRLPLMLGYLLCGLIIGPHLSSWFSIYNSEAINDLSSLGVIFLMFYIGLEFDITRLKKILPSALLAVLIQCIAMILVGLQMASLLGWSAINGLFFGGVLAISSTMVTMPILKGQQALKKDYGQIAIGMLVIEDIIAIIMLVILSGVAMTGKLAWGAVWQVSLLVGVFVVMVFFLGRMVSPYILKLVDKTGNQEVLTLVSVGLVLGIGELSEMFNFSTELGAFMAGAILSQSRLSEAIEHAIEPLRNVFTAVFFVTVGMLIEPKVLSEYWKLILATTLIVVIFKILTCWIGLYLTGIRPKTGFKAAVSKAQIGEFSFVIASLGNSLGVTDGGLMAVAVGVSLGTIFVIPVLSNHASAVFDFLEEKTPRIIKDLGNFYHTLLDSVKLQLGKSALLSLIKRPIMQVIAYFLIFHGVIILASLVSGFVTAIPFVRPYMHWAQAIIWIAGAVMGAPFLFAVIRNMNACLLLVMEVALPMENSKIFIKSSVRNIFQSVILSVVVVIFSGSYLVAISKYLPTGSAFIIFLGLIVVTGFFFWKSIININSRMEHLFIESFKQHTSSLEEEKKKQAIDGILKKYPWPINIQETIILAGTRPCGKRICDIGVREKTGASIIAISRNNYTYYDPHPETPIFPDDKLIVLGDNEQNKNANQLLTEPMSEDEINTGRRGFKVQQLILDKQSLLVGETLISADLRKRYGVNVIGIQRGEKRITNPHPDEIFHANDILVVVANAVAIESFMQAMKEGV